MKKLNEDFTLMKVSPMILRFSSGAVVECKGPISTLIVFCPLLIGVRVVAW